MDRKQEEGKGLEMVEGKTSTYSLLLLVFIFFLDDGSGGAPAW